MTQEMERENMEFDCRVAAVYDLFTRFGFVKKIYDSVARDILEDDGWFTLMDVGGGTGSVEERIVSKGRKGIVFLMDISHCMIERARRKKKLVSSSNPRIVFVNMDAGKTFLLREKIDLAFSLFSYHHWPNRIETFRGIISALRKRGKLWIFEINTGMKPKEASNYYRSMGIPRIVGEKAHCMIAKTGHGANRKELLSITKGMNGIVEVTSIMEHWRNLPIIRIEYARTK